MASRSSTKSDGRSSAKSDGRSSTKSTGRSKTRKAGKLELVRDAALQLAVLTGQRPEKVLGLEPADNGLRVKFELVELERIPHSTDVLGCYVVEVDDDGELVSYERRGRYQRGRPDGESE
jgi:Gas vesicle synthesis protein GvpO